LRDATGKSARSDARRIFFALEPEMQRICLQAPPSVNCRRRNRVHDAIVEAALKIERTHGSDWALALLKDEKVPEEVARRILAQELRQVRARRAPG
jgi:ParB-like chromosome segregation protein Spo0J